MYKQNFATRTMHNQKPNDYYHVLVHDQEALTHRTALYDELRTHRLRHRMASYHVPVTSQEPAPGQYVLWQGRTAAPGRLRDVLGPCAPSGVLRLVVQRIALHDQGRPAGEHEVISSVADVDGNLVAVPLRQAVRADQGRAAALDEAFAMLRRDLAEDGLPDVDAIEVVLDADGTDRVGIALALDVSPREVQGEDVHDAVHDGDHHIARHAPALEDLRDRLAEETVGPLQRGWDALMDLLRRIR